MARYVLFLVAFSILQGCYFTQKAVIPIQTVFYEAPAAESGRQLLVFLPGMGDGAEAFYEHGFVQAAQQRYPQLDVVAVNAHFKYYMDRSLIDRIYEDVLAPAQQSGYQKIYMAGISLGGFGALLYQRERPDDLNAIALFAPYLGDDEFYEHLVAGTGEPQAVEKPENIWPWVESLGEPARLKIYLAYGEADKFAVANQALASQLPANNVITSSGKHRWTTWIPLWDELLDKSTFMQQLEME